jgi:ATP adenylyltransferase
MSEKYNHAEARLKTQALRMKDLESRGICAFCRENVETETTSPIEIETVNWVVKANDYPYERTKLHLLIIPKKHVKTVSELSFGAQQELMPLIADVEKHYDLKSYAFALRSGDMRYNGGSVEHLHAHLIVGGLKNQDDEPVRFKVGTLPKD